MDINKLITNWLIESAKKINAPGETNDIHFSDLFDFRFTDSTDFFFKTLEIANSFKRTLNNQLSSKYGIFLYLALNDGTKDIQGVPKTLNSLLKIIDISYSPEIVLYIKQEQDIENGLEMYRSKLPFQIEKFVEFEIIYKEVRPIEDFDDTFQRDLSIVIQ